MNLRLAALALLALFSFSIVAMVPNAWSLSPITFTTEDTATSINQQFQQVYENGTNSVIMLDANNAGTYYTETYSVSGQAVTSDSATVTSGGDITDGDAFTSPVDESEYSLAFNGSTQYATAASNAINDIGVQDFTLWGWVKRTADSGAAEQILSKTQAGAANYRMLITATDRFTASLSDGVDSAEPSPSGTLSTNIWYFWAISADRDGNAVAYLYNSNTATTTTASVALSAVGSLSNTGTFTVARRSDAAGNFCTCRQDEVGLLLGTALSSGQITTLIAGTLPTPTTTFYDFNEGITDAAIEDRFGTNDLTDQNSPTYSTDVVSVSQSRPTIYTIGRDAGTGNLVYGKLNLSDLSAVSTASQASSYHPRDIVQTPTDLYSPLYNITATGNGVLKLGSIARSFTGYSEATTLHTGNSTVPAHAVMATQDTGTTTADLSSDASDNTVVAEKFISTAALNGVTVDGMYLSLRKVNSPTGTATIGTIDSSGNIVTTFATLNVALLTSSQATYYFQFNAPYTIQTDDRIGIKFTGGDVSNYVQVHYRNSDVYDSTNAYISIYKAGWTDTTSFDLRFGMSFSHMQSVVYDSGTDSIYTFFESGTNTIRAVKRTGSTTLLGTAFTHTTGEPFSVLQLTDRIILQTATTVYQILTSSDAVSTLLTGAQNTRYGQPFTVSPAAFTFSSTDAYMADSDEAYLFDPAVGSQTQTQVLIDTVNTGSSGTIEVFDPARYYYLQGNDLTVEASGTSTTWTIKDVGSRDNIQVTADTEAVGISLVENTTSILGLDVVHQVCDNGDYLIELEYYAVGSDDDCNQWWIYDVNGNTAARQKPYVQGPTLVHANDYTYYTFTLSAADPSLYSLETIYDSTTVDTGTFDSGGQLQQRLLYQQCYIISIEEAGTGNSVQTGTICAGDDTVKPISLTGIIIPSDWLGNTWSHSITRYFNGSEITPPNPLVNSTNNSVIFTFQKNITPYNATVNVIDNIFDTPTINANFTFTGATGASVVNMTSYGINSNQTLYFRVYEDGIQVINDISTPQSFQYGDVFDPSYFGLLFGIPLAMSFPFLTAVMFPKSLAYFGSIVTVAILGIMQVFGFLSLPVWFWALITPVVGIAIIVGYKR